MQCLNCGYTLFNLPQPRCPECSTPFDVTRYSFLPGSVQFGCPVCEQLYEGNDPQGLPFPREFECVQCHQPVAVQRMRVVPVSDEAEGRMNVGMGLPWEIPQGKSILQRWWQTCKLGMFHPADYFRQLRYVDDRRRAIGFTAMSALIGRALSALIDGGLAILLGSAPSMFGSTNGGTLASQIGRLGLQVVFAVPLAIIGLFVSAAFVHIGVRICVKDRRDYTATLVVLAYAMCPAVWALIPILGAAICGVWSLVVAIIGIRVIHRTTTPLAFLAYFTVPLIVLACVVVVAVAFLS
jgi:hypothetical protein